MCGDDDLSLYLCKIVTVMKSLKIKSVECPETVYESSQLNDPTDNAKKDMKQIDSTLIAHWINK